MYSYIDAKNCNAITTEEKREDNNLIEIDENIVFAIEALNKKGYDTKNCCEGHYQTEVPEHLKDALKCAGFSYAPASEPYIEFGNNIKLPSIPDGWDKEIFDTSWNDDGTEINGHWECIRANINAKSPMAFYTSKMQTIINLNAWVEKL